MRTTTAGTGLFSAANAEKPLAALNRHHPLHNRARIGPGDEIFGLFQLELKGGVASGGFEQNLSNRHIQNRIRGVEQKGRRMVRDVTDQRCMVICRGNTLLDLEV